MASLTASKDAADATVIKLERELEVFRVELDEAQSKSATSSVAVSELRDVVEAQRREYTLSRAEAEARLKVAQEERVALAREIEGLKVRLPTVDETSPWGSFSLGDGHVSV